MLNKNENIIKWYPFRENAKILNIYVKDSVFDKIEKNLNVENVTVESLSKGYNINEKYDYITLIGAFEYASTFKNEEKQYSSFLKILKEHLNTNGKIIIAIDNRLGVKYLVGAKNEYYKKVFGTLESDNIRNGAPNLLLKSEIIKFIKEAGFENYKFYYPLSDYKNTNIIFSDSFLPKSSNSKLIYAPNYEEGSYILYDEINIIKQICDNGDFTNFTNSYLVEISNDVIDTDVIFVNYNIFRKQKYQLVLNMRKRNGGKISCLQGS